MAAIDLVGVEHVSLGTDFDGSVETGFDVTKLAAVTGALLDAGLDETSIAAVMGGNTIRFLRDNLPSQ